MQTEDHLSHLIYYVRDNVQGYDVSRDALMTVPRMIEAIHEASIAQVLELKMSALELAENNLTWVLVQQHLVLKRQPMLGESIELCTHPSGKDRLYTYRDFYVQDVEGKELAHASSTWILMNTKSRKVGSYPDFVSNFLEPSNQFDALARSPRLKISLDVSDQVVSHHVAFHDLDFNSHLSNHCYFKWMLDAIPENIYDEKRMTSFNIRFKAEARIGQKIEVRIKQNEENIFDHELLSENSVIAFAQSKWCNKFAGL